MAKKIKSNPIWLYLGLALLFVFIGKNYFIGSLVTTCDNTEPGSIAGYVEALDLINGTVDQIAPFEVLSTAGVEPYTRYTSNSEKIGQFDIIAAGDYSCSQLLERINSFTNDSQYIVLGYRQVLLTGDRYMWCNYLNTHALSTDSTLVFSNYYDHFETCVTEEQEGSPTAIEYVDNEVECQGLDGVWDNSTKLCLCADGSRLKVGDVCEKSRQDTSIINSTFVSNTTAQPQATQTPPEEGYTTQQKLAVAGIIALVMFLGYWIFEKGPDKGLIRGKKRR